MFGIRYMKASPTTFVQHYAHGKVVREGVGQSFFYFGPTATLVSVPAGSIDLPFIFNEVTTDFQDVSIQGELTFRLTDPRRAAGLLDFTITPHGAYRSDDPGKLNDRLIHVAQIQARTYIQKSSLRQALVSSEALVTDMLAGLRASDQVAMLGAEILGLSILAIKATPEIAKALQADAREELLRKADEAIYARRNTAVQLERTIKENELDTEIAVEQKKRQVLESQWDGQIAAEHKKREVHQTRMAARVAVEEQRTAFVERHVANQRLEAEARAHALQAVLEPIKQVDWRTLLATNAGGDPRLVISLAFQELAQNAAKIGQLNVSPDLLQTLLGQEKSSE